MGKIKKKRNIDCGSVMEYLILENSGSLRRDTRVPASPSMELLLTKCKINIVKLNMKVRGQTSLIQMAFTLPLFRQEFTASGKKLAEEEKGFLQGLPQPNLVSLSRPIFYTYTAEAFSKLPSTLL